MLQCRWELYSAIILLGNFFLRCILKGPQTWTRALLVFPLVIYLQRKIWHLITMKNLGIFSSIFSLQRNHKITFCSDCHLRGIEIRSICVLAYLLLSCFNLILISKDLKVVWFWQTDNFRSTLWIWLKTTTLGWYEKSLYIQCANFFLPYTLRCDKNYLTDIPF